MYLYALFYLHVAYASEYLALMSLTHVVRKHKIIHLPFLECSMFSGLLNLVKTCELSYFEQVLIYTIDD